jgi:Ca-activated chloride channel family protein
MLKRPSLFNAKSLFVSVTLLIVSAGCTSDDVPHKHLTQAAQPVPVNPAPAAQTLPIAREKVEIAGGPVTSSPPVSPPVTVAPPSTPPTAVKQSPKGSVGLTTRLSNTHVLMPGNGVVRLEIGLDAADAKKGARLPMNIALVIDRSGSMRGDKIVHTREAARHLISQLTDKDTVAIVSYSDDVRVDLPASQATAKTRKEALDAISRIRPGGSTNLSGGLFRGQDEVNRNLRTGQVNRVILMSDGLANRGITDTRALSQQAQKHAQQGVSVTTMGVGTDYNEDLMTAVADHASGNYYFIEKSSAIASVFTRELSRMFSTVAQAAIVEVLIEDGVELKQVFGYTSTREGDIVKVPLAEMYAGQKRSILLEFVVPTVREGTVRVGEVTLRYEDAQREGKKVTEHVNMNVRVTREAAKVEKGRDRTVEERVAEVEVAAAMNQAAALLQAGRTKDAQQVLQRESTRLDSEANRLGGSKRLRKRAASIRKMEMEFDSAADEPAAAAGMAKKAKADSYMLTK